MKSFISRLKRRVAVVALLIIAVLGFTLVQPTLAGASTTTVVGRADGYTIPYKGGDELWYSVSIYRYTPMFTSTHYYRTCATFSDAAYTTNPRLRVTGLQIDGLELKSPTWIYEHVGPKHSGPKYMFTTVLCTPWVRRSTGSGLSGPLWGSARYKNGHLARILKIAYYGHFT